jgi:hypothetical protein
VSYRSDDAIRGGWFLTRGKLATWTRQRDKARSIAFSGVKHERPALAAGQPDMERQWGISPPQLTHRGQDDVICNLRWSSEGYGDGNNRKGACRA